jgi:hypothetical protein
VQNWLSEKACIARLETEYIDQEAQDVMTLENTAGDSALDTVAIAIERVLMRLPGVLSKVCRNQN